MIRLPTATDLATLPRCNFAAVSVGADGVVDGYVCASVVEGQAWIHEVAYGGSDNLAVTQLLFKARSWLRKQGLTKVRVNVSNVALLAALIGVGFEVEQTILIGDL